MHDDGENEYIEGPYPTWYYTIGPFSKKPGISEIYLPYKIENCFNDPNNLSRKLPLEIKSNLYDPNKISGKLEPDEIKKDFENHDRIPSKITSFITISGAALVVQTIFIGLLITKNYLDQPLIDINPFLKISGISINYLHLGNIVIFGSSIIATIFPTICAIYLILPYLKYDNKIINYFSLLFLSLMALLFLECSLSVYYSTFLDSDINTFIDENKNKDIIKTVKQHSDILSQYQLFDNNSQNITNLDIDKREDRIRYYRGYKGITGHIKGW